MKIGIDARILSLPATHRTGIARWNHNLLQGLAEIDKENEYVLLCRMFESDRVERYGGNFYGVEIAEFEGLDASGQTAEQLCVGRSLNKMGFDVYYSPYYLLPLERNFPAVCLFDDLIPWIIMKRWSHIIPDSHRVGPDMRDVQVWKRMSALTADGIVAISESTRRDLSEFWTIESAKIRTIYCGIEPVFSKIRDEQAIRRFRLEAGLPERFLLYVGTIEPRKNIEGIIRAYRILKERHHINIPIVFAGQKGQNFQSTFIKTMEKEIGGKQFYAKTGHSFPDVHVLTKFHSREEQVLLYNAATLLVWPSFYEGFGLPVLEAMACGLPVITSNNSSLTEVGGDAAVYVDPRDENSIADAMARILSDEEFRYYMVQRSLRQAAGFTCARAAEQFLGYLQEVAAGFKGKYGNDRIAIIQEHDQHSADSPSMSDTARDGLSYEERLKNDVGPIQRKLAPWKKPKKIVIYGAGFLGSFLLQNLNMDYFNLIGFIDSDTSKAGKEFGKYNIMTVQEGLEKKPDAVVIASKEYWEEIQNDLIAIGWPLQKIITLWR